MKRMIVILGICLTSMSQTFADGKIPANVVALDKAANSYIEIHEVTIGDWNVYLSYLKEMAGEQALSYQTAFPDDAICLQAYKVNDYLTNPSFQTYPIVGITYEQARNYCSWRTDYENRNKKKSNTSVYMYYLPTESDFQNAYDLQKSKTSVKSISPVDLQAKGITGLSDNVKEMTENKKVVTGAGATGLRFENYTEAAANLGFRCKLIIK